MTIQKLFIDALNYCNLAKIDILKLSSQDNQLRFQAHDEDRVLVIDAYSHTKYPDISGECGVFNFKLMKGLLILPSFQGDDASFKINLREIDGEKHPDHILFKGGGTKAIYRFMSKNVVPEQASIKDIPWDVVLVIPPSKIAEFQQMASLYGDTEGCFVVRSEGSDLIVDFGNETSSTHSASMTLASNVNGSLETEMKLSITHFNNLMKVTKGANSTEVKFKARGLMGVTAVSDYATYNYYLKKSV